MQQPPINEKLTERIELGVDIPRLREQLETEVFPLKPVVQAAGYEGWSVLSSNGDYRDGWAHASRAVQESDGGIWKVDLKKTRAMGLKSPKEYRIPTSICKGYLAEVMRKIDRYGLYPRRARIVRLAAGYESSYHCDYGQDTYGVRLHIPIYTNEGCTFVSNGEVLHMPADGNAYPVWVNRFHQVFNNGETDRIHLFMDMFDVHHRTQRFRHNWYKGVLTEETTDKIEFSDTN